VRRDGQAERARVCRYCGHRFEEETAVDPIEPAPTADPAGEPAPEAAADESPVTDASVETGTERMRYCSRCGTEFEPDADFCASCGAPRG
jgi:rRNA maturation endonuclease Nob1